MGSGSSTIVDIAVADPDLSTLVTALKAANLVDTLSGTGPFTVFAPTNEAFNKVPAAIRARLLDPKNVKELADILTYHVAAGSVHAKDLKNGESIKTVEGKDVRVHLLGKRVFINRSQVTKADIDASNGVIHIIDELLIPSRVPADSQVVEGSDPKACAQQCFVDFEQSHDADALKSCVTQCFGT